MTDMQAYVKPVEEIAREAGEILMRYYGKVRQIDYKGVGDIVTEADKASERHITARLSALAPDYAFLGEEFGISGGPSDYCWVADPLDGTANYTMRLPIFAVAIGLLHKGDPILGVVFQPYTNEMFSAIKGGDATMNGALIRVNQHPGVDANSLFGFSSRMLETLHPLMQKTAKGRSLGSAALHICAVASGFFDGSIDLSTKLWDVAAAAVILQAAGGVITYPDSSPIFPIPEDAPAYRGERVPFLATNGLVHEACVRTLIQMRAVEA